MKRRTILMFILAVAMWGMPLGGHAAGPRRVVKPGIHVDPTLDPVTNAWQVFERYAARFELAPGDLRLDVVRRGKRSHHIRFQQYHRGVPVYLAYLAIHYDDGGEVDLIENRTVSGLTLGVSPEISRKAALDAARAAIGIVREERGTPEIGLLVYPRKGDDRLVWRVSWPVREPLGDWIVFVDAHSGEVIEKWNEIFYDSAFVYDPNAVQDTNDTTFLDNGNADTDALTNARSEVTLLGLTDNVLVGPYVDLCATGIGGAYKPACQAADPDGTPPYVFDFTRSQDAFEEAVVYYAIDSVQRYIQETLGFDNVNNRAIPVHAHYFSDDNSFYSPGDKGLHFGDGGVDDAEDADVILHEYGHAIQDDQVPGWGPGGGTEQRAMGEGFGDFLAGMFYLDHGSPDYQQTDDKWAAIADWDAVSYGTTVRGTKALRWIDGTNER
ncbi:MAG: hypothetical protein D6795_02390, partial [Deltaproteobacteria bacterium]